MELRHLRYFVTLAEELHFGRAATRLHISQPPLSQQIRQFEEELGLQLFHRTKREVRLTEAGKRVVNEAYLVLGQLEKFSTVAAKAGEGEIGHLSIGLPLGVNNVLVKTLRVFGKHYPGVHIDLHYMNTGAQLEGLRENRLHVGFLISPTPDATFAVEVIRREAICVALPKGHRLARATRIPVSSLVDERFILFPRRVTPGLHDLITSSCRSAGVTLKVVHEADSIEGALTLVSAELGIAFSSATMQKLWPAIVFRPLKDPTIQVEQAIVYRRDAQSPVLDTFLHTLRQFIRK
jgi:DNA-binding transcriptional LysR family regulator